VDPSEEKAKRSIQEANIWLKEARIAKDSGAHRAALNSVYLAFFHSARSVLMKDGYREKSHYCIGVYLEKCVNEEKLEAKWPTIFNSIRTIRNSGQYSFDTSPDISEVEKHFKDAKAFIKRMRRMI
jgi:uncharacterized protein (UPF0332 family)